MRRIWSVGLLLGLLLGGLFAVGYLPRQQHGASRALAAMVPVEQSVFVRLIKPKLAKSERALVLPASIESGETTQVHARASGYVRRRYVELGDKVKAGELLAEIDTPELDLEVEQAEAALLQSEAAISLASATRRYSASSLERIKLLDGRKLTSKQELEQLEAQSDVDAAKVQVAEAARAAASANLRRLQKLKSFARIVAPFAGTVSAHSIERGALVSAASGRALFEVATLDPLRVLLDVPQGLALGVRVDAKAQISVNDYPGEPFTARVAHRSGVLDPTTRTMRVELEVQNARDRLVPGMYARASLTVSHAHPVLLIPATALVTRNEGLRVVTLDAKQRAKLVPVVIERDDGAELAIAEGLSVTQAIVANPSPDIEDKPAANSVKELPLSPITLALTQRLPSVTLSCALFAAGCGSQLSMQPPNASAAAQVLAVAEHTPGRYTPDTSIAIGSAEVHEISGTLTSAPGTTPYGRAPDADTRTYGFRIRERSGSLRGQCSEQARDAPYFGLGKAAIDLSCRCLDGERTRAALLLSDGRGEAALPSNQRYAVWASHQGEGGRTSRSVLGYRFRNAHAEGAIDTTEAPRAYLPGGLSEEQRLSLTCLYAALLLHRPFK